MPRLRLHAVRVDDSGEDSGELPSDPATVDGGFWERLDDGRLDVAAGVRWLQERVEAPVFVSGHSAGAFYLADYAAGAPDIAGRILLSPLTTSRHPLETWFGGSDGVARAAEKARAMCARGEGHLLLPLPHWFFAISAGSLVDRLDEADGRWVRNMNGSTSPVLLVWGERESRAGFWRRLFDALDAPDRRWLELEGTGHSYKGSEGELAAEIACFVRDRSGAGP